MGFMSPSKPRLPPPPKPVTREASAKEISDAHEAEKDRRRVQKGRAATMLTGGRGVMGDDSSGAGGLATKTLMGG